MVIDHALRHTDIDLPAEFSAPIRDEQNFSSRTESVGEYRFSHTVKLMQEPVKRHMDRANRRTGG
jgi:hypothetical protein